MNSQPLDHASEALPTADGPASGGNKSLAFAQRLKQALADVGESTGRGAGTVLARRHKTSRVAANAWLSGAHMPSPDRVSAMAADYGVRFEWLYFGQEPKRSSAKALQQVA